MKFIWFEPWGWIYRPMSRVGWLLVCLTIVFLISVFLAVDRHSHSVSDTLYGIFPYFVSSLMTLYWIASRTSLKKP
jgi:hypothetical protein